uniref:Uncharacterized protein n=1 Tax=Salmonella enteritidis TaxID=149539 RepID=T1PXV9_SALEN|nr:hypothetical protein pS1400_89_0019 [Salmonella enterica subsp. enterica serovar Enteritidis]
MVQVLFFIDGAVPYLSQFMPFIIPCVTESLPVYKY